MTYSEFRRHLGKAGISVAAFARLLGIKANSVSNHRKSDLVPQPYAVIAVLAGSLGDRGEDVINLLGDYGVVGTSSNPNVNQLDLFTARVKRSSEDE